MKTNGYTGFRGRDYHSFTCGRILSVILLTISADRSMPYRSFSWSWMSLVLIPRHRGRSPCPQCRICPAGIWGSVLVQIPRFGPLAHQSGIPHTGSLAFWGNARCVCYLSVDPPCSFSHSQGWHQVLPP